MNECCSINDIVFLFSFVSWIVCIISELDYVLLKTDVKGFEVKSM